KVDHRDHQLLLFDIRRKNGKLNRTPDASVGYRAEKKHSAFTRGGVGENFFVRGYTDGSVVKFDFR
ncbi:hypothetical protein C8J56DRAFT_708150, partial [Mycena floridula]